MITSDKGAPATAIPDWAGVETEKSRRRPKQTVRLPTCLFDIKLILPVITYRPAPQARAVSE